MMQINIKVSNEILDWIVTHVQIETLPEQIQEHLEMWRSGVKTPTFNQIEKTSKATGIPLGYFFLQSPPNENLSLVEYRTVDSVALEKPSRNLMDTMHDMELVQQWTRDYLISEGNAALSFVGNNKEITNISFFANSIRNILHLSNDWFKESKTSDDAFRLIRTAISNSGVIVMMSGIVGSNTHRALNIDEFRAFAMVDDFAPLIFINSNDSINGKLFSLLHEFAHICIGENSLFNDRYSNGKEIKKTESICNAVAAEILVPQVFFKEKWNSTIINYEAKKTISILSESFKCGVTVIARKALDNNFIDISLYDEMAQLAVKNYFDYRKRRKEDSGGGDYYRTLSSRIDHRFFGMLRNSAAEGKTLYSDAFRLTNTNRSTFATLAEKLGDGIR